MTANHSYDQEEQSAQQRSIPWLQSQGLLLRRITELEEQLHGQDALVQRNAELEGLLTDKDMLVKRVPELEELLQDKDKLLKRAALASSVSSYFVTVLASGFEEAGNKSIEFNDVDIAIMGLIVAKMRTSKAGSDLVTLPSPRDAGIVEQIINFAQELHMPWLAQAAVKRAVESTDAAVLVDLLLKADGYVQRERQGVNISGAPSAWEELSSAAVTHLAGMFEEASRVEAFSRLPLGLVQRILVLAKDKKAAWSEWHELAVVAEGAGNVSSPPTQEGLYLEVAKHADQGVWAFVYVAEGAVEPVMIGGGAFVGYKYELEALSSLPYVSPLKFPGPGRIAAQGSGWGTKVLLLKHRTDLVHGDSYKFRFRTQHTKLHAQCLVLLKCVKAHLPPEAQQEPRLMASALELLRSKKDLEYLHAMLVEYMARAFWGISGKVLGQLSCRDMEAIITHPDLTTASRGEFAVLKGVLDWAQGSERLAPSESVGAEVRVRNDSDHEQWRGAECRVVRKIDEPPHNDPAACLWEIERTSEPAMGTLTVQASDLLCPGHVGMERLLPHVRLPFIRLEQIKTLLSQEERALANQSPAFMRGLTEAVEVQTGKRPAHELGKRAQQRKASSDEIPEFDDGLVAKNLVSA